MSIDYDSANAELTGMVEQYVQAERPDFVQAKSTIKACLKVKMSANEEPLPAQHFPAILKKSNELAVRYGAPEFILVYDYYAWKNKHDVVEIIGNISTAFAAWGITYTKENKLKYKKRHPDALIFLDVVRRLGPWNEVMAVIGQVLHDSAVNKRTILPLLFSVSGTAPPAEAPAEPPVEPTPETPAATEEPAAAAPADDTPPEPAEEAAPPPPPPPVVAQRRTAALGRVNKVRTRN